MEDWLEQSLYMIAAALACALKHILPLCKKGAI